MAFTQSLCCSLSLDFIPSDIMNDVIAFWPLGTVGADV